MRNLRIAGIGSRRVDLSAIPDQELQIAAYDANCKQLLFATTSGSILCMSLSSDEVSWTLPLNLSNSDDSSSKDRIVGLEFMMDNEVMAVGTTGGELLSVFLSSQSVEAVGKVEGGIVQMSSSPDGELLAVATGLGLLLLMTPDWEVLYEIHLKEPHREQGRSTENADEFDTQTDGPVQISWRADSKYFATLGGNKHPNGTMELRVWERDTGTLHACSKPFPFIGTVLDWIPSGARLATACSHSLTEKSTRILFFERNGLERGFFAIDGSVDATIGQIRWNCNSELLAVLLRCNEWDAIQIWSFSNYHWYLKQEQRYPKDGCVNFQWDPEKPMRLVTWTVSGLVQVISFCWDTAVIKESIGLVIDGAFLLVTPLSLSLIPPPMSLFKLKFQSSIQTVALHQLGEEYLIAASLSDGAISFVALPNVENWDLLEGTEAVVSNAAALEQRKTSSCLRLLKWLDSGNLLGVMNPEFSQLPMHSKCSPLNNHLQANVYTKQQSSESLVEVELHGSREGLVDEDGVGLSSWSVKYNKQTFLDQGVLAIVDNPLGDGLLVHLEDGSVFSYALERGLYRGDGADSNQSLFSPSLWVQALSATCSKSAVLVALDENGRLQVESRILSTDCTSFTVHVTCINERRVIHIIYTTKQDLLHLISLDDVLNSRESTGIVQDVSDLSFRRNQNSEQEKINLPKKEKKQDLLKATPLWERGAKLITALGGCGVGVVFQTVRGNLETIYPRNLVLGSIAAALCKCNFNDAVLLARQHHINLNILVDFRGWETFVRLAPEFIRQVKNLNYVTELICAVNMENFMDSMYRDILLPYTQETVAQSQELAMAGLKSSDSQSQDLVQGNKVQCVLRAIQKALEEEVVESSKRELCILTTMARSDPPELEDALQRIKKLREEEMQLVMKEVDASLHDQATNILTAEEAMKHLLWLSDSESVFNVALGIYDLHLAAMVASNSQGDPKEFLPLLQELEKMPTPVMQYTIDCKLQRFESALKNLAGAGSSYFNQCLQLMIDNPNLFRLGKHIFKEEPERIAVLEAWGDNLLHEEKFEDAAAAFCCCFQLEKAMGAYCAGGHWQGALVVAGMLGRSEEEVTSLAQELREQLQALGRPGDAAKIALEYCKDVEDAVRLFTQAREWTEAIRVAYSHSKVELVKDIIQPAALECASSYLSDFEEGSEKVGKYLARYLAVKQRRLFLDMKLKMDNAEDVEDDSASDISSNVSGMSAYTTSTRTSKLSVPPSSVSTREHKQNRRKTRSGRIRAGSPGEEAALVEYLKSMELTIGTLEDIRKLLNILVLVGHNSTAEKLQQLACQFQCSQHKAVVEAEGNVGTDLVSRLRWCMEVLDAPQHLSSVT